MQIPVHKGELAYKDKVNPFLGFGDLLVSLVEEQPVPLDCCISIPVLIRVPQVERMLTLPKYVIHFQIPA